MKYGYRAPLPPSPTTVRRFTIERERRFSGCKSVLDARVRRDNEKDAEAPFCHRRADYGPITSFRVRYRLQVIV